MLHQIRYASFVYDEHQTNLVTHLIILLNLPHPIITMICQDNNLDRVQRLQRISIIGSFYTILFLSFHHHLSHDKRIKFSFIPEISLIVLSYCQLFLIVCK